ncbi:uncharacterized protein TRUGW13939_12005 [Talaromyces rugulosus]|uniref:CCHC-type domain-containing protein n=1 Tax=Talaromyces rugulosus TaxID=121627 RepID=A0A7H8RBY5_TALRU|nr:uncharacterized protein TRUGW13939_00188 [Talaromyces rugulosus]XP_035345991.1 uncharacterized protein TRUGW13939_06956 [Talaromyces rugulosus]XP_035350128.1 uncharacterized protein TRUGW13939_11126 [Talaromyces rugulosus]XP_035351002.1 uncharacterized protein TRUGW13939_12005 [Talaromyces rugulosus]QKX53114.1 hypothetical protein TRUGW13939_00188 [Talaromyces rugulosus]QKX59814.1 hypothetical protein TRUGW13939_06956 [Talaromyces rugulosus]QKX63954.1 hypothetical protein TRUGW13939_11126 
MVTTRGMTSPTPDEPGTVPVPNPGFVHEEEEAQDHTSTEPAQDATSEELPPQAVPQVNMTMEMLQALIQGLRTTGPSHATTSERRDTKVPDPKRFASKSIKEFEEWIEDVENNISSRPRSYPDEASKVQYAAAWLDGDHRIQWREKKNSINLQSFTFDDFRTWLEDQIESPQNRGINSAMALLSLTQSNGQDPEAFYSKFSILYEKAREGSGGPPPAEDLFKYRIFLAKLLPKIRSDITRMGTLPAKLPDLITTAQRLYQIEKQERRLERKAENENNNRSGGQGPTRNQEGSDSKPTRKRKYRSDHNDREKSQKKQKSFSKNKDKSTVTCYRCNRTGHYATECKATKTAEGNPISPPKLNATHTKKEKETEKQSDKEQTQ